MARLSPEVEAALRACGESRVMHNDGPTPAVAIRWVDVKVPPETKWIWASGETHDAAGRQAATEFAEHIRAEGARLVSWSDSIKHALKGAK